MAKTSKRASHPWVAAATVCEAVLEEKDNVFSIIRMVDIFNIPRPPGWDGRSNLHIPLRGIVAFRSGEVKGPRTVRIYGSSPLGKRQKLIEIKPEFLGGNTGLNIKFNVMFGFQSAGTHWLDVYVDKWHATRIPVTIVFQSLPIPEAEPNATKSRSGS